MLRKSRRLSRLMTRVALSVNRALAVKRQIRLHLLGAIPADMQFQSADPSFNPLRECPSRTKKEPCGAPCAAKKK